MIDDDRSDDGPAPSAPSAGAEVTEQVVVAAPVGANGGHAHQDAPEGWAWAERPFAALGVPPQAVLPGDGHQAVVSPHLVSTQAATVAAAVTTDAGMESVGASARSATGSAPSSAGGPATPTWQVRLWRAVSRQARVGALAGVVVGIVLGVLGGVAASHGATRWTSTTTMMIDDPYQLATAGDQGELLKLNSLLVKYAGVLGTDVIAQPVAQQLGLSVGQVLSSVTANDNPADETLLLPITATASTPALARRLSQAAANELTAYVAIQNGEFHIPAVDQFTLTTVDPASPPQRHGPSASKAAADALALFVVGFVLGLVVVQLVRNRRLLVA